jgi:hypothetical protein
MRNLPGWEPSLDDICSNIRQKSLKYESTTGRIIRPAIPGAKKKSPAGPGTINVRYDRMEEVMENLLKRRVNELVNANQKTAEVFEMFSIDFCCNGGKTVEAACAVERAGYTMRIG